jgi:hypothetical protein
MNGNDAAALFRQMADRIEKNADEEFSGAFLVVPPGDCEPLDGLSVSSKPNIPAFFSNLRGMVEIAIAEVTDAANGGSGRGRGFR